MKQFQQEQQQPPEGQAAPAGADAMDPTGAGGGNIGTGQAPLPNEEGFTGNEQGAVEQPEGAGEQQPAVE
jgi:hypothetical protein